MSEPENKNQVVLLALTASFIMFQAMLIAVGILNYHPQENGGLVVPWNNVPIWKAEYMDDPIVIGLLAVVIAGLYAATQIPTRLFPPSPDNTDHQVMTRHILTLALIEICALMGFVAGFVKHNPMLPIPFIVLSMVFTFGLLKRILREPALAAGSATTHSG